MSTIQNLLLNQSPGSAVNASTSTLNLSEYYPIAVKSAAVGGVYFGITMMTKSSNVIKNIPLSALVVGASAGAGSMLAKMFVPIRTSYFPLLSKLSSVESRIFEIAASTLGSFVLDNMVLKNTFNSRPSITVKSVSIIAVSDILGELISDLVFSRNLSVFDP